MKRYRVEVSEIDIVTEVITRGISDPEVIVNTKVEKVIYSQELEAVNLEQIVKAANNN